MRRMLTAAAASALCISSTIAAAGLPAAADHVPASALVTIAVDDIADFHTQVTGFLAKLPIPIDREPMEFVEMLMNADGVNEDGSLAFVMMENEDMFLVAPVDNYNAFVGGFGGNAGGGVDEFEVEGNSVFSKKLGGGFAAVAPEGRTIKNLNADGGWMGDHEKAVGKTGAKLANSSDLVVIANMPALAPALKEGLAERMEEAMGMAQMMGGAQAEQMEAQMKMFEAIADSFLRDAQAGLLGVDFADSGLTFDVAAQFKEGSEIAGYFQESGNSANLMGRLPAMDYLFAGAFDGSPKGLRTVAKNMAAMTEELNLAQGGADPAMWLNMGTGFSGVMGKTPGLLGAGLFSNSVAYFHGEDGASVAKTIKDTYMGMDGQSQEGLTMSTKFDAGSVEVDGRTVDAWSMGFQVDPNHPAAMQMQQMMMMTMGPEQRMAGYGAALDKGYVQTMSRNKELMANALKAAKTGDGLGKADAVMAMSKRLPEQRSAEVYIGVDTMLGYAKQFMAMMGGPGQIEIPENLNPIATGMTTSDGGFRSVTVIPMDVIDTLANLAEQMGAGGAPDRQPAGNPRF